MLSREGEQLGGWGASDHKQGGCLQKGPQDHIEVEQLVLNQGNYEKGGQALLLFHQALADFEVQLGSFWYRGVLL